jgi:S1-C subfamily serine protease
VELGSLYRDAEGRNRLFSGCTGSFVTPTGFVLTNSHCVRAQEDYPKYGIKKGALYHPDGLVTIAVNLPGQVKPVLTLLTRFVADVPEVDVALLRPDRLIGAGELRPLPPDFRVPFLTLGDPSALRHGDPIVVIGFPSVGGNTVTVGRGYVTGFTADAAGQKYELKHDQGAPGFSGSPAAASTGRVAAERPRRRDGVLSRRRSPAGSWCRVTSWTR